MGPTREAPYPAACLTCSSHLTPRDIQTYWAWVLYHMDDCPLLDRYLEALAKARKPLPF